MIRVKIDYYSGDTYITRGSCRLFITGYSDRCSLPPYQLLVNHGPISREGISDYLATVDLSNAFEILKQHIITYDRDGMGRINGITDSVNIIALGCVARTQDLVRGSVLA